MARFLAWLDKTAGHGGDYETLKSQVGSGLQRQPRWRRPCTRDPLRTRVAQHRERRITRTMTGCVKRASRATKEFNGEEAERLLLHLYTALPLLPAAQDGGRSAILARFGPYEVRLTEFPPDRMPFLPLWVELILDSGRELVDSCGFSEIEDAVDAVRELVEKARRLHDGS
jgi:hypothetical protein